MTGIRRRMTIVLVTLVAAGVSGMPTALASPPSNDDEASATEITGVPFQQTMDTSEAVPNGPRFCSNSASVFFRFKPAEDRRVQIDTLGSNYDTTLGIYARDAQGRVDPIACNDDRIGLASGIRLSVRAGETYFVMVGQCCRGGRTGGGELVLAVTEAVSDPLEVAVEISDPAAVDPSTGMATLSGVITCNKRSSIYAEGTLRQLRQGMFVARGYWWTGAPCTPDTPVEWSIEIDTSTGVAFATGPATVRHTYMEAYAGWDEWLGGYEDVIVAITIS